MKNDRWSNDREIRKALYAEREGGVGGAVLYHTRGRNYVHGKEGHLIYLGVSGSGKSRRGTIPTVKSFIKNRESFIVVDPKGEIHDLTVNEAMRTHLVKVINFRNVYESLRWNPLAVAYEDFISGDPVRKQTAMESIDALAHTLYPEPASGDPFWNASSSDVFVGLVYALMEVGKKEEINMASVYHLMMQGLKKNRPIDKTMLEQLAAKLPQNSTASMMLSGYLTAPNETAGSIRSVFLQGISRFARSEGLVQMMSRDELQISSLDGETPTAIYIILPDENPIYNSVTGVLCSELMNHYIRIAQDKYNGKLPVRLNVILEELGNLGKSIPNLPFMMSASRSRNIRCYLVLQSLSQLETTYGASQASTIRNNADVLVSFRTSDWNTLSELSHKCGERELETSTRTKAEPLVTPSALAAMETGQALVMIGGRIKFISWLPDFTEMYDCSDDQAPEHHMREPYTPAIFNIAEYLEELNKKEKERREQERKAEEERYRQEELEKRKRFEEIIRCLREQEEQSEFDPLAEIVFLDEREYRVTIFGTADRADDILLIRLIKKFTGMGFLECRSILGRDSYTFDFMDPDNAKEFYAKMCEAGVEAELESVEEED